MSDLLLIFMTTAFISLVILVMGWFIKRAALYEIREWEQRYHSLEKTLEVIRGAHEFAIDTVRAENAAEIAKLRAYYEIEIAQLRTLHETCVAENAATVAKLSNKIEILTLKIEQMERDART